MCIGIDTDYFFADVLIFRISFYGRETTKGCTMYTYNNEKRVLGAKSFYLVSSLQLSSIYLNGSINTTLYELDRTKLTYYGSEKSHRKKSNWCSYRRETRDD